MTDEYTDLISENMNSKKKELEKRNILGEQKKRSPTQTCDTKKAPRGEENFKKYPKKDNMRVPMSPLRTDEIRFSNEGQIHEIIIPENQHSLEVNKKGCKLKQWEHLKSSKRKIPIIVNK